MLDITFQQLILRGLTLIILIMVHGALTAAAARLLGDRGPQYDGRLTLSPGPHFDWVGSLGFMAFLFGWIRPVKVDPAELRGGRAALVGVALLALAGTLAFVWLLLALRAPLLGIVSDVAASENISIAMRAIAEGSVWFTIFNVIPLVPLTGGLILQAASPAASAWLLRHQLYVGIALVALAATGLPQTALAPAYSAVASLLVSG